MAGGLEHLTEVSELVRCAGGDSELQAAALLHDLVEDTDVELDQIEAGFGERVRQIVAAMTEDESIEDYLARKEEHRTRACEAGREGALLFVADKLSNARRMRRGGEGADAGQIGHHGAAAEARRRGR